MTDPQSEVNTPVQPALFPGGAIAITLEALLDPSDHTVIFVCRAWDVPTDKLIALWSSAPVDYGYHDTARDRALREFRIVLDQHTGPFD